ncbi:MAG: Recombinase [Candidatus Yanofskybacteria bacterium GW2011_GWA1_39_13]|uniref:Recombinase n=1 Tax=Yanofskybacteria sp. (strain GW2011_GWA1_39_13) TaxID=1619019 RepID=A0A0G0PWB1_YANXG|nr:MAG: Recombinase [Candidatus Yanofskybacteria bacterium GW2011_GWA1_39_13]
MKIKCVIYARVSSKEQEDTGYSLDAQLSLLKEYAERKGFDVVKEYRIAESASGKQIRKIFTEMLEYTAKHKISVILCEKIDRLTRTPKDASIVDEWVKGDLKREVHFIKESFILNQNTKAHENLVWDMKVAIARFYINNLSEEVKKGQAQKLKMGGYPSRAKIGYKTIGEKGHKHHVVNPPMDGLMREAFEKYNSGNYSLSRLVEAIYDKGLRNEKGGKVLKSRLHELLSDPFYCGKMVWNDKAQNGSHEAIISPELFDSVQTRLNAKHGGKYQKHLPLYKGKVRCEECKGVISWYLSKGKWRGNCNHYKNCSQAGTILETEFENRLLPFFNAVVMKNPRIVEKLTKALKDSHKEEITEHTRQKENLQRIIKSSDKIIEGAYRGKLLEELPLEICEKMIKDATDEKNSAIKALESLSETRTAYYEAGLAIHELALHVKDIYKCKHITKDEQRLLLSYVFSNINLLAGKVSAEYTPGFKFLADWAPKLNNNFEPTKNPSINGASGVLSVQPIESMTPEVKKNFELQKTLILRHDSDVLNQNHDKCSAARTRTWNHLLTHDP